MFSFRSFFALSCTAALLSGCYADHPVMRDDSAKRTALSVFMIPRDITTDNFQIQTFERVYQKGQPATLYIEGDGLYTVSAPAKVISDNPTPTDPVALRLAAQDSGQNVLWAARPCQYNKGWRGGKTCPADYSGSKKFAPEVIDTYNQVLDNMKAYYGIPSFDIVGYDGGAAIAVILASQRGDITSVRTVAGNLDNDAMADLAALPHSTESLNAKDFAAGIANIPQRHFIGKMDTVTPPAVYNSFAQAAGQGPCLNVTLVDRADHQGGWVEQWKVLKDMPMDCAAPPEPVKFDPAPLNGDKGHIKKYKK